MQDSYLEADKGERVVEVTFICEMLEKYGKINDSILDVGGIPTTEYRNNDIYDIVKKKNMDYSICDFRGGEYKGDFVTLPIEEKFDIIIFLSSLEHFPQCTEGDLIYREDEDIKGFQKALTLLKENGKILLTVPFGEPLWQAYHQNYDLERIKKMSGGSKIIEQYIYRLCYFDKWTRSEPKDMKNVFYTNKCFGVGNFIFTKGE